MARPENVVAFYNKRGTNGKQIKLGAKVVSHRHRQTYRREALDCYVRSKTKGEVRLDDTETRISGARHADVTGLGALEPSCQGFGIGKILKKLQLHPRQGCRWMSGNISF
jgi:hypothetical protein